MSTKLITHYDKLVTHLVYAFDLYSLQSVVIEEFSLKNIFIKKTYKVYLLRKHVKVSWVSIVNVFFNINYLYLL